MEIDKRPEQQQPQFNSILNPQPAPNKVDHQKSEQQTMEQQNLQQQNIGLETGKDNALENTEKNMKDLHGVKPKLIPQKLKVMKPYPQVRSLQQYQPPSC
ncbi:unnamed protein product [Meloidogyne enterolobii]|uniref:Uncharacterized protein n=1 Tax=Meloidogyne enterolobii TaxID=390850 RepID=A0ACB1AXN3_MELEN